MFFKFNFRLGNPPEFRKLFLGKAQDMTLFLRFVAFLYFVAVCVYGPVRIRNMSKVCFVFGWTFGLSSV